MAIGAPPSALGRRMTEVDEGERKADHHRFVFLFKIIGTHQNRSMINFRIFVIKAKTEP